MLTRWNEPNLFFLVAVREPVSGQVVSAYLVGQSCPLHESAQQVCTNAVNAALNSHSERDGFKREILASGGEGYCREVARDEGLPIDES